MTEPKAPAYVARRLARVENMSFELVLGLVVVATSIAASSLANFAQRRDARPIDYQLTQSVREKSANTAPSARGPSEALPMCFADK